jgi:hypothetical protein
LFCYDIVELFDKFLWHHYQNENTQHSAKANVYQKERQKQLSQSF